MFGKPHRKTLIYISGAITPTKANPSIERNIERMHNASLRVFNAGYSVYCPATPWFKDPGDYGDSWKNIMEMDLEILSRCDGIFMLSNWKHSRGATLEHEFAVRVGMLIGYELINGGFHSRHNPH